MPGVFTKYTQVHIHFSPWIISADSAVPRSGMHEFDCLRSAAAPMGQPEATAFNGVLGMTPRDVTLEVKNRDSSEGFDNLGTLPSVTSADR